MSDLKNSIMSNILDKKFNKATKDLQNIMKDKVFTTIDDFKKKFVFNPNDLSSEEVPVVTPKEEPKDAV
jgi:hypothetical protein